MHNNRFHADLVGAGGFFETSGLIGNIYFLYSPYLPSHQAGEAGCYVNQKMRKYVYLLATA